MPKVATTLSRWFPVPDDPLKGKVHVRRLKDAEVQSIMDKVNDRKVVDRGQNPKGERLIEVELRTNASQASSMLAVACVLGWENFFDEKDQPLDCTPENVRLFAMEDGFTGFLKDCREVLNKESAEAEEEARKNLKALGSGSPA